MAELSKLNYNNVNANFIITLGKVFEYADVGGKTLRRINGTDLIKRDAKKNYTYWA